MTVLFAVSCTSAVRSQLLAFGALLFVGGAVFALMPARWHAAVIETRRRMLRLPPAASSAVRRRTVIARVFGVVVAVPGVVSGIVAASC